MITEAIVRLLAALIDAIAGIFPEVDTPAFFGQVAGAVDTISGNVAALGNWVPLSAAGNAVQFVLTCIGFALLIKVVRIGVSLFTGGGGGAA